MRRPARTALLFLLVVVGYAVVGFAAVGFAQGSPAVGPAEGATTSAAENVTVSGQVTDANGQPVADAYVLLEPAPAERLVETTEGERSIGEILLRFALAEVDGVTVAETDDDGRYEASVPQGEYAAIAVTEESRAVSTLPAVDATDDASVDLEVDPHHVVTVDLEAVDYVHSGETVTLDVDLENPDDRPVESLSVDLSLPSGWAVERVETDGDWNADARRLDWTAVPAGERVSTTVTLRVPADADLGSYGFEVTTESRSHFVDSIGPGRIDVLPEGETPTPTPTGTPSPVEDVTTAAPGGSASDDSTTEAGGDDVPTETPESAPGFGPVAVVVVLVASVLASRR